MLTPPYWLAGCFALACLPAGRQEATTSVIVMPTHVGPYEVTGGTVRLDRAVIGLGDFTLIDDDGQLFGSWSGERRANLLGTPGPHGTVTIYDGHAGQVLFRIVGSPAITFSGWFSDHQGRRSAFLLERDADIQVTGVVVDIDIDAARPPASLSWIVALDQVVQRVAWRETTTQPAQLEVAFVEALADPTVWHVRAVE